MKKKSRQILKSSYQDKGNTIAVNRLVVERNDGEKFTFIFPAYFDPEEALESIRIMRVGYDRDWRRELRDATLAESELCDVLSLEKEMKYIVLLDKETGREMMFIFPKCFDHDRTLELLINMVYDKDMSKKAKSTCCTDKEVSAGFITETGCCHGTSESIGIKSRPEKDKILFKHSQDSQFIPQKGKGK